jgi:ribosomal protein L5
MQSIKNKKEFLRKFHMFFQHKNINEFPNGIDKVTLFIVLSRNLSLKNIVKASALLELISGIRPSFIRSKKSSIL